MLTEQQTDLLTFIKRYMRQRRGVAPTYQEMAAAVGQRSKSGVHRLILGLEERGAIRRLPGKARAIEIIRRAA